MFSFDPATGQIRHVGSLTEACGEKGLKAIPQGKSPGPLATSDVDHPSHIVLPVIASEPAPKQ